MLSQSPRRRSAFSTRLLDTIPTLWRDIKRQRAIYTLKMFRATPTIGVRASASGFCRTYARVGPADTYVCHIAAAAKKVHPADHFRESHKCAVHEREYSSYCFVGPVNVGKERPVGRRVRRTQCFNVDPRSDRYLHTATVIRLPGDAVFSSSSILERL